MGIASAASGALGVAGGLYSIINGAKERKEAEDALNNYERQKLTNVAEGLQVSTLGSDLQREEAARLASTSVDALREGGSRALIGGLGRVQANSNLVNQQIAAGLDAQQKAIDQIQAEDDARIRSMQENREIGDINALSSQVQAGKQDMNMGMGNIVQGVGGIGGALGKVSGTTTDRAPVEPVNSLSPQGVVPFQTGVPSLGVGKKPIGYDFSGKPIYSNN